MVTNKQTDRQTNDGKNIIPRFRGHNEVFVYFSSTLLSLPILLVGLCPYSFCHEPMRSAVSYRSWLGQISAGKKRRVTVGSSKKQLSEQRKLFECLGRSQSAPSPEPTSLHPRKPICRVTCNVASRCGMKDIAPPAGHMPPPKLPI